MCGIAAIFGYASDAPPVDRAELLRIRDRMTARGPDGCGLWLSPDGRVGLAHRRLAIIDLSEAGAQPMATPDGRFVVTFNGEIYNYRELRAGLEQKGHRFRSTSDTEVLLHLYEEKGEAMLAELRGMYAFALWDHVKQGMLVARDPFGIKPLYLSDDGKTLRVASQVKALLAGGSINTAPEPAGHAGFFLWGAVPEPYTLYRRIRALPAGSSLWVPRARAGTESELPGPKTFFSVPAELAVASREATATTLSDIQAAFKESVRRHLVADVPVVVFLSAGLDSCMLAALVAELNPGRLHTVTLGFREYKGTVNDEVPQAETVAARLGSTHRTIWVERGDFHDQLPRLLAAMDQPSVDGVNSYFVSLAAVRAGYKVALSGLGGDELFGTYPSFRQVNRLASYLGPATHVPTLGRAVRHVTGPLLKRFTSPKYAGLLEYGGSVAGAYVLRRALHMPWELDDLLDPDLVREGLGELQTLPCLGRTLRDAATGYHRVAALEMVWYMRNQLLRDTDWASMSHSLEVRVPFLGVDLFRTAVRALGRPNAPTKRTLASMLSTLPPEVLNRRKTGFSVPVREWLLGEGEGRGVRGLRCWAALVHDHFEASTEAH